LKKKLVIITGAGRGIGKAVSETLASSGYACILIARNPKEIKHVEKKIKKTNGVAFSKICDTTDYSSVQKTVKEIILKHGNIYGLVTCAASSPAVGPSDDLQLTEWNKVIQTDLTGTFITCQIIGKNMIKSKIGRIINISSFHSIATYPERVAYASAKNGVIGLTKALAVEWGKDNITVNAISPGPIKTPRTNWFLKQDPENEALMISRTPIGRLEIQQHCLHLLYFLIYQ
jgi:gluconate 5-dehydrogenase